MKDSLIVIVILMLLCLSGFILLIWHIVKAIKFSRALKEMRKELPEMMKAGLIDYNKDAKLPEIW